ncbi:MAG: aminotransferase class I/II-fold pyridoxal phosphate-dependent enzyme [Treponema sp.]|jgi:histidinol-phosphate/aromatic aminotransferase/cobyric acid decarboxylase-like protein/choline kinase|nr:aminotransferase class I/II-fold pyridoxal phosphate-dependent enzyme [Treponema sp.]
MQAIILAAGMGNRLGKYTADNTKCMLPVNGKTLIERALDALDAAGVRECVMVVGYKKENVIAFLGNRYKNINVRYVSNDVYNKTNNIYSLYLAKDFLINDDTLLLESDLIFEERLIADMLASPEPTIAAVAAYEPWMDGTVVQLAQGNVIANFIPKKFFNYNEKKTYYKTVNIYKFSKEFSQNTYIPFLEAYCKTMGNNEYYEQVLRVIATLDKHELKAFVLNGQKWYEIDDVQDKQIAEIIFSAAPKEKLAKIQRRYGGYWRFPGVLDFCYLVNPYFPTRQLLNELKASFRDLLTAYPSGLNTQNTLAGKLFSIDEKNILVGNGAAELIRALASELKGSVGVFYPTFNEYPESFLNNEIVAFDSIVGGQIKEKTPDAFDRCDNLLLINPDNPSGDYTPKASVMAFLEKTKNTDKRLILDESFIDFSDYEENPSLLKQELLEEYPNLIVIKSLSKSYGIPGLRLGVLACGDQELIAKIRKNIPIWNVNSFAEYFLQIIGKYVKDYQSACKNIAEERKRFQERLSRIPYLKPFPSQANYVMGKLEGVGAGELAERLLDQDDIFIKDLTGKKGVPDGSFIRVAVRGAADNDRLAAKLTDLAYGE